MKENQAVFEAKVNDLGFYVDLNGEIFKISISMEPYFSVDELKQLADIYRKSFGD